MKICNQEELNGKGKMIQNFLKLLAHFQIKIKKLDYMTFKWVELAQQVHLQKFMLNSQDLTSKQTCMNPLNKKYVFPK